jgi:hypothetical protein
MEQSSESKQKLLDQQFTESVKSNATYANKEFGINGIDRESIITGKEKNELLITDGNYSKGKVHMLNYFDCESGTHKKLLVKRIGNS